MCEVCVLGGGGLAVVFDPGDGGFAEETVLVVHQVLVDTGSAERHRNVCLKHRDFTPHHRILGK